MKKTIALLALGLAISGCETSGEVGRDTPPGPNLNQTFGATFADGTRGQFVQRFSSSGAQPNIARICFVNNSSRVLTLLHEYPGVNPMTAAPGGRSCANFGSGTRVAFALVDQSGGFGIPVQTDKNITYSLTPMDGGVLTLTFS